MNCQQYKRTAPALPSPGSTLGHCCRCECAAPLAARGRHLHAGHVQHSPAGTSPSLVIQPGVDCQWHLWVPM